VDGRANIPSNFRAEKPFAHKKGFYTFQIISNTFPQTMLAAANQKTFAHTGAMKKMPLIFSEDMRAGKKSRSS
jgi:hypothetical protein